MILVQSFEEFYAINRKQDEPDHSFLYGQANASDRQIDFQHERYNSEVGAKYIEKALLRYEYEQQIKKGLIVEPSRIENLLKKASGHPDNKATQAAKRLLEKYGVRNEMP